MKLENVTCFLPIEVKARELDTKVFLALRLVEKGFSVAVGSKIAIHKHMLLSKKPFIYFSKGINPLKWDLYNTIKFSNGLMVEIQEEGNISKNYDVLILVHNNPSAKLFSLIFTWGNSPKKVIENNCPNLNYSNIKATGHPSFDLLHQNLIGYYKALFNSNYNIKPNYILINTNFGIYNGYSNYEESQKINNNLKELYNEDKKKEWLEIEKLQGKVLFEFLKMIKVLSKSFPQKKIIIRPHPMEKMEIYKKEFKEFNNIEIIREGSAREWIVNSEAVIHYDCSTGIEALIARKNVISFCPFYDEKIVAKLPIEISTKFNHIEDLVNFIKNDYKNQNEDSDKIIQEKLLKLECYLANVEKSATDKIIRLTENLAQNSKNFESIFPKRIYYLAKFKFHKFILLLKSVIQKKYTENANIRQKFKFSKLEKSEIEERLDIWCNHLSIKDKFKVKEFDKNIFLIER